MRQFPELAVPPPENLHLTLAFLGGLDEAGVARAVAATAAAASRLTSWTVAWGKPGAFPSLARPRVLWLGLAEGGKTVDAAAVLAGELRQRELAVEDRPFRPHLTVARVRAPLGSGDGREVRRLLDRQPTLPPTSATGLVLYQSRLAGGPAVYEELASAAFQ